MPLDGVAHQPNLPRQSVVQDIDLFLMLCLAVDAAMTRALLHADTLIAFFYLAYFVHVGLSLHVGRFNRVRTVTWVLLIGAMAGTEVATFLGFVLPWGQLSFWLASLVGDNGFGRWLLAVAPLLADRRAMAGWDGLLLVLIAADVVAVHYPAWRRRSWRVFAALLGSAVAVTVIVELVIGTFFPVATEGPAGSLVTFPILPPWPMLPYYAMLRAMPGKLFGVIVTFAALLIPAIWPWARVDALRTGRSRGGWPLACLAFVAAWLGLGWLGMLPMDEPWATVAQGLTLLYFGFFLQPFLLRISA